jgi:hypothetical protein
MTTHDSRAERFAAQVDQQVPMSSSILNWEWEVEFYSQHSFIHPPYQLSQALFSRAHNQRHEAILDEPTIPPETEYLIVGPFADMTHVFTAALDQRQHRLLHSEGLYQLYQLY